jgi:hypothetical protein
MLKSSKVAKDGGAHLYSSYLRAKTEGSHEPRSLRSDCAMCNVVIPCFLKKKRNILIQNADSGQEIKEMKIRKVK